MLYVKRLRKDPHCPKCTLPFSRLFVNLAVPLWIKVTQSGHFYVSPNCEWKIRATPDESIKKTSCIHTSNQIKLNLREQLIPLSKKDMGLRSRLLDSCFLDLGSSET